MLNMFVVNYCLKWWYIDKYLFNNYCSMLSFLAVLGVRMYSRRSIFVLCAVGVAALCFFSTGASEY